jgi:hypothetical protein
MATVTKQSLSYSTNGKQIAVSGNASSSYTPIHAAVAGTSAWDEVYLYATNLNTSSVVVGIWWGGTTTPNDLCYTAIPNQSGRVLICDGKLLQNGLTASAFATVSASINIDGFVNRIQ